MKTMFSICIGVLFAFIAGASAQEPTVRAINGGVVNGKAVSLPKPVYPEAARAAGIGGVVGVNVIIDESGQVVFAEAMLNKYVADPKVAKGAELEPTPIDPTLREAAEGAARMATFSPTLLSGQPVKVKGMIVYNFGDGVAGPANAARTVSGGVLNGKASSLPAPAYPAAAMAVKAEGTVSVQVSIDEEGSVISAAAVSGHPLLRAAAVEAAREAKFAPTQLEGKPVRVSGVLTYNFVLAQKDNQ